MMFRFTLPLILIALVFNVCSRLPTEDSQRNNSDRNQANSDLKRDPVENGIEVTFYPAYGYREAGDWRIPMRTWVHENRESTAQARTQLGKLKARALELTTASICAGVEGNALNSRLRDFSADDIDGQQIEITFDSDPDREHYQLGKSNHNGLIENELKLPDAKSQKWLSPGSKRWLTYHAVGLTGKGRIRLIESKGTSVITDIDDTIKVSDVPSTKTTVLKNTFCCGFVAAPEMAKMYRSWGDDVPFHYVSGGPWQLYGPLYDYLISDPGAFPEGTFHLRYIPKNILEEDTRNVLRGIVSDAVFESMFGSLKVTYLHKKDEITKLLDNFPGRTFIFVGDSGELDPEVYRWFKDNPKYSAQVQEIRIRDVVNDKEINPDRLKGMNVIPADPKICATQKHYDQVRAMIKALSGNEYTQQCDPQRSAPPTSCP